MLVRKKDGRDGKRKAGMKEAKVDGVLGRSGRRFRKARREYLFLISLPESYL